MGQPESRVGLYTFRPTHRSAPASTWHARLGCFPNVLHLFLASIWERDQRKCLFFFFKEKNHNDNNNKNKPLKGWLKEPSITFKVEQSFFFFLLLRSQLATAWSILSEWGVNLGICPSPRGKPLMRHSFWLNSCRSQSEIKWKHLLQWAFRSVLCSFNVKMPSSCDSTAATATLVLISLASARLVVASCISSFSSSVF